MTPMQALARALDDLYAACAQGTAEAAHDALASEPLVPLVDDEYSSDALAAERYGDEQLLILDKCIGRELLEANEAIETNSEVLVPPACW